MCGKGEAGGLNCIIREDFYIDFQFSIVGFNVHVTQVLKERPPVQKTIDEKVQLEHCTLTANYKLNIAGVNVPL